MGFINKLDKDLIDDAYENYGQKIISEGYQNLVVIGWPSTQEEFINKIKTDDEFAKRWDITIETKELSEDERINLLHVKHGNKGHHIEAGFNMLDEFDISTKLIRVTYNNETIESYE
jgi:hypothetical protein